MEIIGFVTGVVAVVIAIGLVWYCRSELDKMAKQTQHALNTMSQQQQGLLEELAQKQGAALKDIIEKQSKINKTYKRYIEKILETQKWHSQILKFEGEPAPIINLDTTWPQDLKNSGLGYEVEEENAEDEVEEKQK